MSTIFYGKAISIVAWEMTIIGLLVFAFGLAVFSTSITTPLGTYQRLLIVVLLIILGGGIVGLIYKPYTQKVGNNHRITPEPEYSNFARICRGGNARVNGVWTVNSIQNHTEFAKIYGMIPGNRHLFIDEEFFEVYTPEEQSAIITREAALADNYYHLLEVLFIFLVLIMYYSVILAILSIVGDNNMLQNWPYFPELLFILLLVSGIWYARQIVYRADQLAAKQTSAQIAITALEKFECETEENNTGILRRLLFPNLVLPSRSKRIKRLREFAK